MFIDSHTPHSCLFVLQRRAPPAICYRLLAIRLQILTGACPSVATPQPKLVQTRSTPSPYSFASRLGTKWNASLATGQGAPAVSCLEDERHILRVLAQVITLGSETMKLAKALLEL